MRRCVELDVVHKVFLSLLKVGHIASHVQKLGGGKWLSWCSSGHGVGREGEERFHGGKEVVVMVGIETTRHEKNSCGRIQRTEGRMRIR